jgi:hypothetical protein
VLLDDDVVADGEAKSRAFPGRFGREERVEHLFFHVRRDAGAVIANPDFNLITEVLCGGRKSRLVVVANRPSSKVRPIRVSRPGRSGLVCMSSNHLGENPKYELSQEIAHNGYVRALFTSDVVGKRIRCFD